MQINRPVRLAHARPTASRARPRAAAEGAVTSEGEPYAITHFPAGADSSSPSTPPVTSAVRCAPLVIRRSDGERVPTLYHCYRLVQSTIRRRDMWTIHFDGIEFSRRGIELENSIDDRTRSSTSRPTHHRTHVVGTNQLAWSRTNASKERAGRPVISCTDVVGPARNPWRMMRSYNMTRSSTTSAP